MVHWVEHFAAGLDSISIVVRFFMPAESLSLVCLCSWICSYYESLLAHGLFNGDPLANIQRD